VLEKREEMRHFYYSRAHSYKEDTENNIFIRNELEHGTQVKPLTIQLDGHLYRHVS